jgi:hypothetical protein
MDDPTAALAGATTPPAAAPPAAATPAPAANAPQPIATPSTGEIAQQPAPQYQAPAMTTEPARRGGFLGVLDAVTDMLAGRDKQVVTYGQNGRNVQQVPLTRGQQYAKLSLEALTGAARGAAAPPGPAHTAQGFAAGTMGAINDQKQGEQDADANAQKQFEDQQKAKLNELNYQLGIRAISKNDLELKAMGVKASQDAITFSNQQIDREKTLDSYDLGTAKDSGEIADIVSKLPSWEKELYRHEGLQPHPVYDEQGNRIGIRIFLRKPDIDSQPAAQGTKVPKWVPGQKPGEAPHTEFFTPLGPNGEPPTNADIDKYNRAYLTDVQAYQKNKADADDKAATAANLKSETAARDAELPSKIAENRANANRANAAATKDRSDSGAPGTAGAALVDEIGSGKMPVGRMAYLMARNPQLLANVAAKYPDFDGSKIEAYEAAYKDFTSQKPGSAGAAINSANAVLKHMHELDELNTPASHIPHSNAWTKYQNKANTVSTELARFYGTETIPGIGNIHETLTSTLPGNRHAAITTQVQSLGDKLDAYGQAWKNAAPSPIYEAQMPDVDEGAKAARAALDPKYAARFEQQKTAQAAPQPASHAFSPSAWSKANPGGDVNAAIAAAKAQGFPVVQ